jgi:hypothetical protein
MIGHYFQAWSSLPFRTGLEQEIEEMDLHVDTEILHWVVPTLASSALATEITPTVTTGLTTATFAFFVAWTTSLTSPSSSELSDLIPAVLMLMALATWE